jgi:hypothetical protein
MLQPIKLESLRELVSAGSVKSATILGQKGGYAVVASVGMHQRPLGTKFGDVRMFGSTDTAVKVLRDLGLFIFHLDVSNYEEGRLRAARPDVTLKAKEASQAVAHDRWFRDQVQPVMDKVEAGTAVLHDHDEVWNRMEAHAANRLSERAAAAVDSVPRRSGQRRR